MSNGLIIFLYSICAYGISNMMVFSSGPFRIFERIRSLSSRINEHFGSMFSCMICFPANVGWICSLADWFFIHGISITPFNILLNGTNLWWLALIGDCCFTTGVVWLIHNIESYFENMGGGQSVDTPDDNTVEIHG